MTPEALAALHARAMTFPPPWDARAIRGLLDTPGTFAVTLPSSCPKFAGGARGGSAPSPAATPEAAQSLQAFAIGRVVLDEAELLTLAVDPDRRRQGQGRACLRSFEAAARDRGATRAFLEVAASNAAARALYAKAGYGEDGFRRGYYRQADAPPVDAILLSKALSSA